ncbi:AAA family ATPase [Thiorhodococcus mannitoliphagus]|uniref:AAA family ATPase n=1 Tax=Thiorhodococcus mannitoliphagus TaxID=329406 RepID=A0A6P1E3P8_9GAMM|nr:bifunctional aminoglycoside phosphotransferase/ATP-binding protein [Thiorhodococcus mannitoliphagus]NEX23132.1 AAA family ATPase [Thiorhodococcus mannitoliphagus]
MPPDALALMLEGLNRPEAYPYPVDAVQHIETHISHVLLAGDFAYKLKKPLNLGFLDFSTVERRRHCCEEELRLNRRLAPSLYLDIVPITGSPERPQIGGVGPVLEHAVRMRRFPQAALLDRRPLSSDLMCRLAELVADFHAAIPVAGEETDFGTPEAVLEPMLENLRQVRERAAVPENLARLDRLEAWTRQRFAELRPRIEQRRRDGFVREGHGDMHRGNIALVDDQILIFDAIEFNPYLRWIDTASEIAFLVMDLEQAGATAEAQTFLNRYLERSGDYGALAVLDVYKVYRAMVRSKVQAIRLGQPDLGSDDEAQVRALCSHYLGLAESYTRPHRPRLLIACGLSGSGKSRMSRRLREALPMIHLRSDLERKRLFGLHELARTATQVGQGIYFRHATDWTYDRLHRLAETVLSSGYDCLVDATFIARDRRERFHALARRHHAGFGILALDAPLEVLRERVKRRLASGTDASEASLDVLERQHAGRQCLSNTERCFAVHVDTSQELSLAELLASIERVLNREEGPQTSPSEQETRDYG